MRPPRLLLDANLSPSIVERLWADGYDVDSVRNRGDLLQAPDWTILQAAIQEGRAVCSKNRKHFEREHALCQERGVIHFGVLILGDWRGEEVYKTLRHFLETHQDTDILNELVYVEAPEPARDKAPE